MSVTDLALIQGVLVARRYGVDLALPRRIVVPALGAGAVAAAVAASALGYLVGAEQAGPSRLGPAMVVSVPVALLLLALVCSPARRLRSALQSGRSWLVPASCGTSVRDYVWGRYLLVESTKQAVLLLLYACFLALLLLAGGGTPAEWLLAVAALVSGACVGVARAAVVLRATVGRATPGRRTTRSATLVALVLVAAGLVALSGVALVAWRGAPAGLDARVDWVAEALTQRPALTLAVPVALLAAVLVAAVRADRALRRATWAELWEVVLARRTARISAPALPQVPLLASVAADARRLARSHHERLRPVLSVLVGLPLLLVVTASGLALTGQEIALPPDVPRLPMLAGGVAMAGYVCSVACASLLAMDADRHALTLWQTTTHGVRTVAAGRAVQGAVLTFAVCCVAAAAATLAFDLTGWEAWVCLLAGATMAVFGPAADLLASLVWPDVDWTETNQIGTSSPGRYAASFVVGAPVAAALALLLTVEAHPGPWSVLLGALLLALAVPVAAALFVSAAVRLGARRFHA